MEIANYAMTCPCVMGTGSSALLGEKAKELGISKAFIVTDPGIEAAGVLEQPVASLEKSGIEIVRFTKVNADPLDTMCVEGAELCKTEKCDGIIAICDPVLTYKLPAAMTAATGLDTFAHCAESVTCNVYNPLTATLAMDGIQRVAKWLYVAYTDPTNVRAREEMMIASNYGGIAFSATCCHLGHCISQQMGAVFHVPHGISCAWALPEVMAYSAKAKKDKVQMIADYLEIPYEKEDSSEVLGQKVADGIRAFMRKLDVKSIKEYGIARGDLIGIADLVMADNCFPFIPSPLTKSEVEEILGRVYDTYQ